jgi:predicted TIM-barrel fold metal-dependent hydrolase
MIDARLDEGFAGVSIPAGAVAHPAGLERCAALLDRLDRRGAPLLVHPGPGPGDRADAVRGEPSWWPALTGYVSQMNAAWHAFLAFGRRDFPDLRVVFAMLAGLAPLHVERLRARGGPTERSVDSNIFYDSSSYGSRSVDAMIRCVGVDQIVYGSDRPVVEPGHARLGEAARHATLVTNPARLLGLDNVEA